MANQENANAWMTSMKKRLSAAHDKESWRRGLACTIYRVPQSIRQVDQDAYVPKIISIGPYHRGEARLEAMEEHKWRFLNEYLSLNRKMNLEKHLEEMKKMEERTRSYYSESVELESNEFVEMMLLDGCFIVQFLIKLGDSGYNFIYTKYKIEEPIFNTIWMVIPIVHDILLLENQIPFFILEHLYQIAEIPDRDSSPINRSLVSLTFNIFDFMFPSNKEIKKNLISLHHHHFLHLLHTYLQPKNSSDQSTFKCHLLPVCIRQLQLPTASPLRAKRPKILPSATELQEAGVTFKKTTAKEDCSFVNIRFSKGVMEIPPLHIYENTNSILRNLIAFEQCYPNSNTYCTAYAMFVDDLIKTPKDVVILSQSGIIHHGLGSDEELALLFNKLCKGHNFYTSRSHLSLVYTEVNKYWEQVWHKWRASMVRNYFSSPWSIISLLAATLLLLLTIAQTVFPIVDHFHHPKAAPAA